MTTSARRVSEHRARMREQGFRPVQIWVRDTRSAEYQSLVDRQCAALWNSPSEADLLDELEALADRDGWA